MSTGARAEPERSVLHAPTAGSSPRGATACVGTAGKLDELQRLADRSGAVQRLSALQRVVDGDAQSAFGVSGIQTKLRIGEAGGSLEREADRVASEVTREPAPTSAEIGASVGVGGSESRHRASPLPSPLRGQFESRLGVDLGSVRVHSDARADAMAGQLGAAAFTHRSDIYFARGAYRPDTARGRWLLGHELTHVAQQSGGQGPGISPAPASTLQCYFILPKSEHESTGVAKHKSTSFPGHESDEEHPDFIDPETKALHRVIGKSIPDLLVSDDGKMAVEQGSETREVETFFADNGVIDAANKKLKSAKSAFTLKKVRAGALTVPKLGSTTRVDLTQVEAQAATYSGQMFPTVTGGLSGPKLWAKEQCIQLAEQVMGGPKGVKVLGVKKVPFDDTLHDIGMKEFLAAYIEARKVRHRSIANAKSDAKQALRDREVLLPKSFERFWDSEYLDVIFANQEDAEGFVNEATALNQESKVFELSGGKAAIEDSGGDKLLRISVASEEYKDTYAEHLDSPGRLARFIKSWKVNMPFKRSKGIDMEAYEEAKQTREEKIAKVVDDNPELLEEAERQLGMNEFANPDVAQAFQIFHLGDGSEKDFPYHFAGVVAKSGKDVVTFENYARDERMSILGDQRMYFRMYGPQRDVKFEDGKPVAATGGRVDERDLKKGSFHAQWKDIFVKAQTVVRGK